MPLYALDDAEPQVDDPHASWIAPDAALIGKVRIGPGVGIWFGSVLRGDAEPITIGARSNLQEHTIVHTDPGYPTIVGEGCTIGHRALLHGCTIGDGALVGMGAIVLNGARIGRNCLVGAGSLVTEGKVFEDGWLIMGSPARPIRPLDEAAIAGLARSAEHYCANAMRFRNGLRPLRGD